MSSTKWKVAWNTVSQLLGKVVGSGLMLLVSIMVARAFGSEGFGDFTKITTFVAFFYLLVDFGLNAVYLKKIHAMPAGRQESPTNDPSRIDTNTNVWGTMLGIRLVGGTLLMFVAIAILVFLPQSEHQGYTGLVRLGIILYSPTILIQGLIVSANAIFQKRLRYDLATLALTTGNIVTVLLVWGTVYGLSSRVGVIGVTTSLLLGLLVTGIISLVFVRHIERPLQVSFDRGIGKALFMAALPLGITLLFNQVYFRIDSFVLALTRSTSEVGLYGLAYKVFELPLVIPTFFMNSVYPILLTTPRIEFIRLLKRSVLFLFFASCFAVLVFWFVSPLLSSIRPEFIESVAILRILIAGLPFFFFSSVVMWALIALGKQIVLAGIYGSLMVVTIVFDVLVIPRFGAIGAAWITVGSEAVVLLVSSLYLRRALNSYWAESRESANDRFTNKNMNDGIS